MDSPKATPAQSNLPPNIRRAPGLTLTAAEESLLARAFASSREIFVEREFRSGYSGAVVLLVSPGSGQAQVVVKLGSPVELQQEYAAYQQFVKQASPQNTARLQSEPLLTADEQLALLSYTFAGGDPRFPTHSLQAYFESKGGSATAAVLDRIFRVYGRQWWAINRSQKFVVGEQYDQLLPVHLKLKPASLALEETSEVLKTSEVWLTLVAGQINAAALRDLEPGQPVRLQGFRVAETRPDRHEVKLTANPPPGEASAPLRLRLETDEVIAYPLGERVETLDTVITATRQTILAEAASSAWPAFEPEATHLNLNGRTYPNPLLNLPDLLDRVIEARVSTIHGDLNLQNILVDEETGFAWLIDFAETRRGPTLFDLQRLESQVITKLLPPAIAQAGLEPAVVADLLESLHADPPSPAAPHPALQEPYTLLVTLRRLARQYLMDDRDWDEYYLGLVITLLGSLKYPELEPVGRELAVLWATTARGLIGVPFPNEITDSQGVKQSQRPRLKGGIALSGDIDGNITIHIGDKRVVVSRRVQLAIILIVLGIIFLVATQAINLYSASVPTKMEGDFNIAVAQFQVVGQGDGLDEAQELAQSFANAIEREINKLADEIEQRIEVRPPQKSGGILGTTEEERANAAYALAEKIDADIVVYGVIEVDGLAAKIKPEFYVRSDDFMAAAEVTGQYRMGSEVLIDKVNSFSRKREVSEILADRFRALTFIIYGLADYVIGNYERAEINFNEALKIKAWNTPDVVYVMLGNAALKQRSLSDAERYYRQALEINPAYSRSYAGLASTFYAQALGDTQSDTYDTTDIGLLNQSIETYHQALNLGLDHPPLADVTTKANFGLGQAYLLKANVEATKNNSKASKQDLVLAIQAFQSVILDYGKGENLRVVELAAHAHGRLGLIYRLTNQWEKAILEYEQALDLLPPLDRAKERKATYEAALGDIYINLNQSSKAIEWYEQAIEDAPPDSLWKSQYQEALDRLR